MPTRRIPIVHPVIDGTALVTPAQFLQVWQPKGWELQNPDDEQYLEEVPPAPVNDVITRDELVAYGSATFARVVDGELVGPDDEPIEVGTSDILLSDTRPVSPTVGLVRIGLVADTTAPTVPINLSATPGDTQVALDWNDSTDAVGVTGYRVRRGGTLIASPTTSAYTDTGRTNGVQYSYTVSAVDAAGNESAQTSAVVATAGAVTTVLADTFNRANADVPGNPQIGPAPIYENAWIRSNGLALPTGGARIEWPLSVGNSTVEMLIGTAVTPGSVPGTLNWHFVTDSNRYFLGLSSGAVGKTVGGSYTPLGSVSGGAFLEGQTVKVVTFNGVHTIYRDGVQVFTFTDSGVATGGIKVNEGGASFPRIESITVTTP